MPIGQGPQFRLFSSPSAQPSQSRNKPFMQTQCSLYFVPGNAVVVLPWQISHSDLPTVSEYCPSVQSSHSDMRSRLVNEPKLHLVHSEDAGDALKLPGLHIKAHGARPAEKVPG